MRFRGTRFPGNGDYRYIRHIRYETLPVPHPEAITYPDHPVDLLAFLVIIYLVVRSNVNKVPISRLLRTIVKDATLYFLVIFTSHLTFVMFLAFASVRRSSQFFTFSPRLTHTPIAQLKINPCQVSEHQNAFPSFVHRKFLRAIVEVSCMSRHIFVSKKIESKSYLRFLPMMITRLLLSLKKAVATQEYGWNLGEPTAHTTIRFAERRGVARGDEIPLDIFPSTHEETKSEE